MSNSVFTTIPYRRCESVYKKLRRKSVKEISSRDLNRIISKYCASSPQMKKEYENRFQEYNFLKKSPNKPLHYLVNLEVSFFEDKEKQDKDIDSRMLKKEEFSSFLNPSRLKTQTLMTNSRTFQPESKTVVYPRTDSKKKQTCSFKGDVSLWKAFVGAVKEDGFPSICFVEHIFHVAYLNARKDAEGLINIPFRLGSLNFFVTIISPYVVERPRRYRKHVEKEVIDEEENW